MCFDILCHYNSLEPESKKRNVTAWRPVVVTILNALADFDDEQFKSHMPRFYEQILNLLLQEVTPDVRLVLYSLLMRAGVLFGLVTEVSKMVKNVDQSEPVVDDAGEESVEN